ncbi:MAG: SH3 domain-containing protein [Oscillospiraceae bacterium]|nr:SH3 domain-containing protein [Oscillospiraceae bacterium]
MIRSAKILRVAVAAFAVSGLCLAGASATSLGMGTVQGDGLRMRDSASTSGAVLATASTGTNVIVLADAGNNWYKVDFQAQVGYMSADYVTLSTKADGNLGNGKVSTDGATLNMRSGPATSESVVSVLSSGTVVQIVGVDNGWYKISYGGNTGYASSDYITTVKDGTSASTASSKGQEVVNYAKQLIGCKYSYGCSGPSSFDCSGFTSYVYKHFGYTINRSAATQLSNGTAVDKSSLQPGDLVFFKNNTSKAASHVGIYIGSNQFIHASTNTYTVRIDNLSGYYSNIYVGARHII